MSGNSALTDFLMARIAEDEQMAQAVMDTHEMWGWDAYVAQAGMYDEPASEYAEEMNPARVLAECAAKRRIVERCAPYLDPFSLVSDRACTAEAELAEETLSDLAAAYAEHPDYRQEWKA